MKITSLILKVAERCNLACRYCYMYEHADNSYRERPLFMSEKTFSAVLSRARSYCMQNQTQLSLVFHGGEPTLVGRKRMGSMIQEAREVVGEKLKNINIQSNATLIDEEWANFLASSAIGVGVSVDGAKDQHDRLRIYPHGLGSYEMTVRGISNLRAAGVKPFLISVASPGGDGAVAYAHLRSLGASRMNFLLPDVTHDSRQEFYPSRSNDLDLAYFLIGAYDAWRREGDGQVRVLIFRDLIQSINGRRPYGGQFGNHPTTYLIVDSDGSIQGSDSLKVCAPGLAETGLNIFDHELADVEFTNSVVQRMMSSGGFALCAKCQSCPEVKVCGGGFLPDRWAAANGFANPSVWCADILALLRYIRKDMRSSLSSFPY
jgi:uncharacterized protein